MAKQGAKITLDLPGGDLKDIPDHIQPSINMVGTDHADITADMKKKENWDQNWREAVWFCVLQILWERAARGMVYGTSV